MKKMKKMMALVIAMVMVLGMTTMTAFAADLTEVTAGTAKSITITTPSTAQATDEFQYTIYKVFDATSDGTSAGISYKATAGTVIEATDQLSKFEADAQGNVRYYTRTATTDEYAVNTTDTQLSDGMIAALAAYTGKTEVGTVTITGKSASKTVDVGSYGYFYITTTSGTVVTIDSTNPSASVNDKNTLPTMDKDIASVTSANGGSHASGADNEKSESATANVGDTVNYTVTINAKKGADSYVYHDILSAGLTLVTDTEPVIKAGSTTLTKGTDYTLTKFANNATNGTEDNITITFTKTYLDSITADTTITITYSAIVNDKAVIAGDGNKNTGTLDYGHKSDGKPNTTPPDEPKVYTYQFQLVKDDNQKKVLTGAEFKLYQEQACSKEIALVKVADGKYRVATAAEKAASGFTAATIEAGTPEIIGLGNGDYYLKETKAPEGYNLLADPVKVTINNANNNATFTTTTTENDTYASGGVEVVNQQGTELPSTGGIGTTIFYIIGAILVLGAGILLVTRRRMNAN
jgi:LPXTG-motif cell wall-anchored protein